MGIEPTSESRQGEIRIKKTSAIGISESHSLTFISLFISINYACSCQESMSCGKAVSPPPFFETQLASPGRSPISREGDIRVLEKGTVTFSSLLRENLVRSGRCRRQNRNNLLILMTKPRFRKFQPRSGRKPPVTSRSSV